MKIEVTAGGIYDGEGKEVPVGTTFDVKDEPQGWAGRYRVVSKVDKDAKTPVTNPKKAEQQQDEPKTAAEVLAMGQNSDVQFMTFKAAATKLLGDKTPATKAEIVTALEDLATQP